MLHKNGIKLGLRPPRVNAGLDPGGRGKELVGKGSGTVRARLARVQFYKRNPKELIGTAPVQYLQDY